MSDFSNARFNSIGTQSIPKLILQFSVPSIISMSVESLYNVVDRFFVAEEVGYLGITGITLCFPISLFIMAMSILIGIGGNILFSLKLGQKKHRQAAMILNHSLVLLTIVSIIVFALGQIFLEPLLKVFGASEVTLPYAKTYMSIILLGVFFQTINPGMNNFIRSMGHPKTAMFRMLIGAFCNVFFDWLFIVKFHWGIAGAAWATILSQFISFLFIIWFFFRKNTPIKIQARFMHLQFPFVRRILILGFPMSMMQVCNSLMNVILNRSLATYGNQSAYGGDLAISAFGVINSIAMMIIMPLLGFVQGTQPILGYNYGAKYYTRVKSTVNHAFILAVSFLTVAWILIQIFAPYLTQPFASENKELQELASNSIKIFLLGLPAIGIGMICGTFFQATGKPGRSIILNMSRQVLILIPLLLIIPNFYGLSGVFMAAPISDTLAALLGLFLLSKEWKKMPNQ